MKHVRAGAWASRMLAVAAVAAMAVPAALAQSSMDMNQGPPKYLYVSNAELKPGNSGALVKLESEEVDALRAAKIDANYFGMWSITGNTSRVLFFRGFNSYGDLEKIHDAEMGNAAVEAVMHKNSAEEGAMEVAHHGSIYEYEKDLSQNPPASLEDMRFARIILFQVKDGQQEAWEHLVKEYKAAYASALPEASWAMFEKEYGEYSGTTYILITPLKSLADVDTMEAGGKTFMEKTGPDMLDLLRTAGPAIIASEEADLYAFGPRISYVPDKWLTDSADFWGKK
ncbi:MAG: hypothetical protein WBD67_04080 [Terracidiphilus sp.]